MGFECYRIGDLLLDAGTQELTREGVVVAVPRLSFLLLLSLTRHAPNVVSAEQLEKEVWSGLVVDRGTVNKRVLLLRKSLSEGKGDDQYIAVVRGSGYRLVAPVERIECPGEESADGSTGPQTWYGRNSGVLRKIGYGILGIIAVLAVYHGFRAGTTGLVVPKFSAETQPPTLSYSQKSIAVLPFVDLSDGQAHQYLGDGIAEEVINLLADMDGLRVAARTSSFSFRNTPATTMEISNQLKVGTILEGSVRHSAERLRVTAQLIDTQTGYHIWSKNYDRAFDEIFKVQDDIAANISQALKLTVDENHQINSSKTTTDDIEAFALFLKGRELLNDRMLLRNRGLFEALEFFKKATKQDPEFARAYADIALVYWLLPSYDESLDEDAYFELAEASAKFALEFDPNSVDALSALAAVHSRRGELVQAAALFDKIRVLGRNDSNVVHWEAMLHIRLGYFDELINPLTEVYRLDPLNEHIGWVLATALNFSGEPEKAADILLGLEHFTYRQYVLGLTAINNGDYALARNYLRGATMRSGILPDAYADMLIDALENPDHADEVANNFISAALNGDLEKSISFESLLLLGSSRVFDLDFDIVNDVMNLQILGQFWNNWGTAMRQDPRFKGWLELLGYIEFWRIHGWPDRCRPTSPENFECI